MIPWLHDETAFPDPAGALIDPDGLLCAGGDLSPTRLLDAYRQGIFPWFSSGQPILWWSPDPRMVLFPKEFRISRSLRKTLRAGSYEIRLDHDFAALIHACATTPRHGQGGTWITAEMRRAYLNLFELGYAHSVETWVAGKLAGGLYGVAIGGMFYGESMFTRRTDASKIAAAHLARHLAAQGYGMIDCQMRTPHLASLGAREIARSDFICRLQILTALPIAPGRWVEDAACRSWTDNEMPHVTP